METTSLRFPKRTKLSKFMLHRILQCLINFSAQSGIGRGEAEQGEELQRTVTLGRAGRKGMRKDKEG